MEEEPKDKPKKTRTMTPEMLEKLNMQAILSATQNENEYVKESFVTFEKVFISSTSNSVTAPGLKRPFLMFNFL